MEKTVRRIDHIVMPVVSSKASRTFFEALGFTVAPAAVHPFGTENACVFFEDGTYLEPLAIADPRIYAAADRNGTVFVRRDAVFRARRGTPGFSGMAFASRDAAADWQSFDGAELADGDLFQFARTFEAPDGSKRELGFRLAFAADSHAPDLFFFACQALAKPGDRSALAAHANGVTGIARLVLSAEDPADVQRLLHEVLGQRPVASDAGSLFVDAPNARIDILTSAALALRYGAKRDSQPGLRFEGVVLTVPDLGTIEGLARRHDLPARRQEDRLVVPLAGQTGPFLAFEAKVAAD